MKNQNWQKIYLSMICFLIIGLFLFAPGVYAKSSGPMLKMVKIEGATPAQLKKLARMGIDVAAVRKPKNLKGLKDLKDLKFDIEAVVSAIDEKKLNRAGIKFSALVSQAAMKRSMFMGQTAATDTVYHSFDEPTLGIKDQIYKIAADYPKIARVKTIGYSIQNRPLLAVKLSGPRKWHKGDDDDDDGDDDGDDDDDRKWWQRKNEVLYLATHHAREWIVPQMAMRLLKYLTSNYGTDTRVTNLLDSVNVWIVPVANPDGYEYTFTHERLWRKNLRDNDGDGEITIADGVDLNRNFSSHWGYDDEGSSPNPTDMTYRGTAPYSEPETKAVARFIFMRNFKYIISYHSYGNLILYPWGWQVKTPSFDDAIFVAQSGTDENPAIWDTILDQGYDPGVGADLYMTNGEFSDWCYDVTRTPAYILELTLGRDADDNFYGFEFPDDEGMVQTVFEDNLEFALSVGESAADPAHPVSPVGMPAQDVYHTPLTTSWGANQNVEIVARKWMRKKLYYKINDGSWQRARFRRFLGDNYNDKSGVYYSKYKAVIRGQSEGDQVTYKIKTKNEEIGPFTYTVASTSGNPILILSAEDYSGGYPDYPNNTEPNYLDFYTEALDTAGFGYDVYDVTANEAAPDVEGILSHYDMVIWYTGDDFAATVPGFQVHQDNTLNIREFQNYYDGKLFATGQGLAWLSAAYGMFSDDFFQYYLGAFMHVEDAGMDPATHLPYAVAGEAGDPVFDGLSFNLNGPDSADNQTTADTFLVTSYFLPNFESNLAARYVRPGGPFDPHSGDYYMYSQMADSAYKRLGGTFTLPVGSPTLKFWISYDIETNWDYAFVEIREVGTDNWTTLVDQNGLTTTETGDSCSSGWVDEIHPHLAHFMGTDCSPTGTTGEWNAFTGSSSGWQQVEMDLSAYAGKEVEIHISYATDWGTQNLGVFVDDIELSGFAIEDFEAGTGSWSTSTAPGSMAINNWLHMTGAGFPEGPAIRTSESVYLGFGFEGVDTPENRAELMERVAEYLLP